MDFNQFVQQQNKKNESNNGFGDNKVDYYTPKNPVLRLGNNVPDGNGNKIQKDSALVRILPPVGDSFIFFKEFRTTGINFTKKSGESTYASLTLPAEQGASVIDPYINNWIKDNVAFNRFPNKPSSRYFIHVIEYFNNNGQVQPKTDSNGNIMIQPMEISATAFNEIMGYLSDGMLKPSENSKHSFISADNAFLLNIRRAKKGEKSWGVTVYQNAQTGALPQGWETQLSDLEKLAQPTEELNPNFVNFLINTVNNTELSTNNFKFNRTSNVLGEEPDVEPQAQSQQDVANQMPSNIVGNPQQPQQDNSNPFASFNASELASDQVPFVTPQENSQQQVQQPQQPQQQVQQNEPEPASQEPPQYNQPKSIDSVLEGLDLDNL